MKKIILLSFIIMLLCGCYDYRELNDMSIVSSIGISYENNEYVVSLEITESVKSSNDSSISTKIVKGQDKLIANAFSKAMKNSNKQVYMELVKVLVLSEDVAKEGILPVIDYIIMSTNINSNYRMVVTKDIDELLKIATICRKHNVLMISDEVHSDLIRQDIKFTPMMKAVGSDGLIVTTISSYGSSESNYTHIYFADNYYNGTGNVTSMW